MATIRIEKAASTITGTAGAAVLASGIGCFVLGLLTTLAVAIPALSSALNIVSAVGSLSGKTTVTVLVWLVSWGILHLSWRGRERAFAGLFATTLVLIALGILGTFPLFFELFAPAK